MQLLEEMIIRLSQLLIDFPEIAELDLNPVLIKDGKPVAVDARIFVSPLPVPSSLHLVIGPYPEEDESHMVSVDGRRILSGPSSPRTSRFLRHSSRCFRRRRFTIVSSAR